MIKRRKEKQGKALWFTIKSESDAGTIPEKKESVRRNVTSEIPHRTLRGYSYSNSYSMQRINRLKKSQKKFKTLRNVSKKKRKELLLYSFTKKMFLKNRHGMDIHHTRGRISSLLLDVRFWLALDRQKHNWIGENPKAARQSGLICQPGEWNNPPNDETTHRLKEIMATAEHSPKRAKLEIEQLFFK